MWKFAFAIFFLFFVGLAVWNHLNGYKSSGLYKSNESVTWTFQPPLLARIVGLHLTTGLETYIGGWIESGQVTITGIVLDEPMTFSGEDGLRSISFARMGEWYDPNFQLNLSPARSTSCSIRVVYRFR